MWNLEVDIDNTIAVINFYHLDKVVLIKRIDIKKNKFDLGLLNNFIINLSSGLETNFYFDMNNRFRYSCITKKFEYNFSDNSFIIYLDENTRNQFSIQLRKFCDFLVELYKIL